jgi:hypothetical protein
MNAHSSLLALALALVSSALPAVAQSHPPAIASISACSPTGAGGLGSCPPGTFDTHQIVVGSDGVTSVNQFIGGISDEHSSVFAPGTLDHNPDYLFFVASLTPLHGDIGLTALTGGSGPNKNGQWMMDFASADGYGTYAGGSGQVFLSPSGVHCPTVADGNPAHQDQTFDLNYAAPGSVVLDPTVPAGNLLMIYEGTIICFGQTGGTRSDNFYSSVGVATSRDYGRTWPTYRGTSTFSFVPLPGQNTSQGPNAPFGALGSATCMGSDCTSTPPASYGRYAVLTSSISAATAMATGQPLSSSMGDAEMSAFLDDAAVPARYVYATYNFNAGAGSLLDPRQTSSDLMIARAQLNGGTAPLTFSKWDGQSFGAAGIGGIDAGIFPAGAFQACEAPAQTRYGSSISYVDETQQYLLTFVCDSPGDPAVGKASGSGRGGAWYYSTSYDLSDPRQWSTPREIAGSWESFDASGGCSIYKGYYPTLMSPGKKPGHLSSSGGYIFYLWGCQTAGTPPPGRQYSSRAFSVTLTPSSHPRVVRH